MMISEVAKRSRTVALTAWLLSAAACSDTAVSDEETRLGTAQAPISAGACCDDGDCLCHEDTVNQTSATSNGPFSVKTFTINGGRDYGGGTVFFPSNAEPPFSAFVMCPGFTARQSSIKDWGPFFASHGIVLMTIDTSSTTDPVNRRDDQLLAALDDLKAENTRKGGPLLGALDLERLGVSGWSMGGGGAWLAGQSTPELKSVLTLAGHHRTAGGARAVAGNLRVPTLMFAGSADTPTLGGGGQSQEVFQTIDDATPKMLFEVRGASHFVWGTPKTDGGAVGRYALSWQKVFLDGDQRFLQFLQVTGPNASDFRSNL